MPGYAQASVLLNSLDKEKLQKLKRGIFSANASSLPNDLKKYLPALRKVFEGSVENLIKSKKSITANFVKKAIGAKKQF